MLFPTPRRAEPPPRRTLSRLAVLAALGFVLAPGATVGCGRPKASRRASPEPEVVRIGYLATVSHQVPLSAAARGSMERELGVPGSRKASTGSRPVRIEWKAFTSGPQEMEALLAGALDAGYVGPGPAEMAFVRTRGEAVMVLAGAASGGAALVVRPGANITRAEDLRGRTVASPQLGNTQDVALRTWLREHGLHPVDGGDVRVVPMRPATIEVMMRHGQVDAAWLPEPWPSLLAHDLGARVLVDERSLWPERRFPTVLLVASPRWVAAHRQLAERLVAAHVDEILWLRAHPDEGRALVGARIRALTGTALPDEALASAWPTIEATWDPMPDVLEAQAAHARALHYLPEDHLDGLVDRSLLAHALSERGLHDQPSAVLLLAPPAASASLPRSATPAPTSFE